MTQREEPAEPPDLEFGRLFDVHAQPLHRYLARRVGRVGRVGRDAANDLVSETFLAALNQRHSYDPERGRRGPGCTGSPRTCSAIMPRTEVRALRAHARSAGGAARADTSHDGRVAARVDAATLAAQLAGALAKLSEGDRDVLLLTSWAGLDSAEIAEALGIPVGTVRSRLHRVRRTLRATAPLAGKEDDHG